MNAFPPLLRETNSLWFAAHTLEWQSAPCKGDPHRAGALNKNPSNHLRIGARPKGGDPARGSKFNSHSQFKGDLDEVMLYLPTPRKLLFKICCHSTISQALSYTIRVRFSACVSSSSTQTYSTEQVLGEIAVGFAVWG